VDGLKDILSPHGGGGEKEGRRKGRSGSEGKK
jgi:hypothetical protein